MTTLLLDTHVLHWWATEPERLSKRAATAIEAADTLAVASITWFELAAMAQKGRIVITSPVRAWLDHMWSPYPLILPSPLVQSVCRARSPVTLRTRSSTPRQLSGDGRS